MLRMHTLPLAILAIMLLAPATRAGETAPAKGPETNLEAKVKALEQRIQKLEDELAGERQKRGRLPQGQAWNDWLQRRGLGRDLDEMMDKLSREMQRDFGSGPGGWTGPRAVAPSTKPRLGVELAAPSTELRERYKNDAKEGAFVMSVVPGSPAEKAGLSVGDAITAFNGKPVASPRDLIDAVKAAPPGRADVTVERRGESLKLKVDLGEAVAEAEEEPGGGMLPRGGWLRRNEPAAKTATRSRTEVKASALELPDALAKDLKLSDEQRKKMSEVLAKHEKELSEEAATKTEKSATRRGAFSFSMTGDVSKLIDKHVAEAEKELTGTLTPEQLQQWATYRKEHNSVSVSQSMSSESRSQETAGDGENLGF
ncbi:MAG: PDZ domain-containing protein [Planctomycetota bacterium]|nr:PDZ domain-containing protein [Planctomycetota bacterium]